MKKFVITLKKKADGGTYHKEIDISSEEHEKIIRDIQNGEKTIFVHGNYIPLSSILCIDEV